MKIQYGLADFDRASGIVSSHIDLLMDGVQEGMLHEFLRSAGENGWELCGAFPSGIKGIKRSIVGSRELRECQDAAEQIAFVFKRVE